MGRGTAERTKFRNSLGLQKSRILHEYTKVDGETDALIINPIEIQFHYRIFTR
jgi:hypothetical protein